MHTCLSIILLLLKRSFGPGRIWTKKGSWRDDADDFQEISHGTIVGTGVCHAIHTENCTFASIPVGEFERVELLGGAVRQSFWVTLTTDDLVSQNYEQDQEYRRELEDVIQASTPDLDVYFGASVFVYPLEVADQETDFREGRGFIGRIWYSLDGLAHNSTVDSSLHTPSPKPSVRIGVHVFLFLLVFCLFDSI